MMPSKVYTRSTTVAMTSTNKKYNAFLISYFNRQLHDVTLQSVSSLSTYMEYEIEAIKILCGYCALIQSNYLSIIL